MAENYFQKLFDTNVSDKIEKKNGLSYVSWSYAWAEIKKMFPDATYTVYERQTEFGPVNYFTDGRTCWVKTGMTVNGIEHIEMLPVMDYKNNSILFQNVKSTDVNKAIQRSLTKAAARHGLGLYVYAGEDLPECENQGTEVPEKPEEKKEPKAEVKTAEKMPKPQLSLSPEMAFLSNELSFIAKERNTTMESLKATFEVCRKVAVKQKIVPDKKVSLYTMDEVKAAVAFMKKSMVDAA